MTNPEGTDLERLRALAEKASETIADHANHGGAARWFDIEMDALAKGIIALIARCLAAEKERDDARVERDAEHSKVLALVAPIPINGPPGCKHGKKFLEHCPHCEAEYRWREPGAIEEASVEPELTIAEWQARAEKAESALAQAIAERDRMAEALKEIAEGAGAYNRDPLQHATNCIEEMKARASQALTTTTATGGNP